MMLFQIENQWWSGLKILSGTAAFLHNMNSFLFNNYKFTSLKKCFNSVHQSKPKSVMIISEKIMVKNFLDVGTIATCFSSFVSHRWQFKLWEEFLPHPVWRILISSWIKSSKICILQFLAWELILLKIGSCSNRISFGI